MNRNLMSRRQFIKSAVAAIGAATVSACGASQGTAEIIIKTAGWPINTMPTKEAIADNPALQPYADALQTWLNRNPNVRIERIEANIWDPSAMLTAVAGDTAPTYFLSTVLGNWSAERARGAFSQGLMADLTDVIQNTRLLKANMLPQYKQAWDSTGAVDGRTYYFPIDTAMNCIYYRRDLVKAAGLQEPTADWTWDQFFELVTHINSSEITGMGVPWHFVGEYLDAHGFDLLTQVPTPDNSWPWRKDFSDPRWTALANRYRQALFQDDSMFSNVEFPNNQGYTDAFHAEAIALVSTNILSAFSNPLTDTSIAAIGRRNGSSYEETIGFAPFPAGDGFRTGGVNFSGGVSLPPNASPELIEAAIDLVDYIYFGEAADAVKVAIYESTGDLQSVYTNPLPLDGKYQVSGVPGSFADAWGARIQAEIETLITQSSPPRQQRIGYFPPEGSVTPDKQAIDDLWSQLTYVEDAFDVAAEFKKSADIWNQQADAFSSSIDRDTFLASAAQYYDDIGTMLKEGSPEFYTNRFLPFKNDHLKAIS